MVSVKKPEECLSGDQDKTKSVSDEEESVNTNAYMNKLVMGERKSVQDSFNQSKQVHLASMLLDDNGEVEEVPQHQAFEPKPLTPPKAPMALETQVF